MAGVVLLVGGAAASAATFTVDSTDDAVDASPGDGTCATAGGHCTLRAAIQEANARIGADAIDLPAGVYTLMIGGTEEDLGATGDLDINDDLTITGAGAATTIIDGNALDRVIDNTAITAISDVTIRNGNSDPGTEGGGIQNYGELILTDVTLSDNVAGSGGGGIENATTATLANVTLSGNRAWFTGGGIKNDGTITLMYNVTISDNQAGTGGGGLENVNTATLSSVTLSNNTAGGIENAGAVTLKNTIVANNTPASTNCVGTIGSSGHNLDSGGTCGLAGPGDLGNADPVLGPLQDNGGSTATRALLAGSAAIDAGSGDCPPPSTDQRGVSRPVDGDLDGTAVCDIGAFEALAPCPLDIDGNGRVEVASDVVYIARHLLGLTPVPPSFRELDPTIPPDAIIAARVEAVRPSLDVDVNGLVEVSTDVVYVARRLLSLTPVPPSFRAIDQTIPPDETIAANVDALCP